MMSIINQHFIRIILAFTYDFVNRHNIGFSQISARLCNLIGNCKFLSIYVIDFWVEIDDNTTISFHY